jgi:hypothetical protein
MADTPTEALVHNVAAWRALVDPEWLERIFFPYEHLLAHGRFLRDRAVAVDGRRVTLASGDVLEPDYLVLATGSAYPFGETLPASSIRAHSLRTGRVRSLRGRFVSRPVTSYSSASN